MNKYLLIILWSFSLSQLKSQGNGAEKKTYVNLVGNKIPGYFKILPSSLLPLTSKYEAEYNKLIENSEKNKNKGINSKFYLKFNLGYGFITPGSYYVSSQVLVFYNDQNSMLHDSLIKNRSTKGIGGGLRLGGGIGFVLNDFLNIGIDADYIEGNTLRTNSGYTHDINDYGNENAEMNYKVLTLTPYVIFKALSKPGYFIYNKLGILLTLPSTLDSSGKGNIGNITSYGSSQFGGQYTINTKNEPYTFNKIYKLSMGIGLNVAFGINFRLNNKLRAFGEFFGIYTALTPSSASTFASSKDLTTTTLDSLGNISTTYTKELNFTVRNTIYKNGGSINYQQTSYENMGTTPDGYAQSRRTFAEQNHTHNFNLAVAGMTLGILFKL